MGYLYFTHRIWRSHPMPQMADGFKVVHEAKALDMRFVAAMIAAIVLGAMAMYWARLQAGYIWGSGSPWSYAAWIMEWRNMKEPNYTAASFGVGGERDGLAFALDLLGAARLWLVGFVLGALCDPRYRAVAVLAERGNGHPAKNFLASLCLPSSLSAL
jgi:hypothetical protein